MQCWSLKLHAQADTGSKSLITRSYSPTGQAFTSLMKRRNLECTKVFHKSTPPDLPKIKLRPCKRYFTSKGKVISAFVPLSSTSTSANTLIHGTTSIDR